ncbi:BTAD domain-containing putative transcriptional regulator [Nonomuraea sp. NPDC050556]|uniref:AfsR/SARP family transcriptional regulator n=1 Tax=Nonomuraea sp. NPDC050556 TaxID=3364369 RepID=UPI00379E1ECE
MIDARILGPLEVRSGGRPVDLGGPRARTLLAGLLLQAGAVVSVERLADLVWEGSPPPSAQSQVRVRISRLRAALGHDAIETAPGGYRIRTEELRLDAHDAERLLERARTAGPGERSTLLRTAMGLWRGPVLDGLPHPAVARWEELLPTVTEEWARAELELGRHRETAVELVSPVARFPLRERLRELLMLALWRSGRQAEALRVYAEGHQLLAAELGTEPGRRLRDLHEAILRGAPGPAQLPPARPRSCDPLDRLLEERPGVIVITGNDEAVLPWAHRIAPRYPDGQLYADLSREAPAFLPALGVDAVPDDPDERSALLRTALRGRRMLILLANAASSAQVRPLLPGSPGCLVVVTTRADLAGLVAADNAASVSLS